MVSKFKVGVKSVLQQGLSEPEFYGDLVYKFRKIVSRADFSDQFRKVILRYKRIGYNITVKPVLVVTSIKQATCIKQASVLFPKRANTLKCTCIKVFYYTVTLLLLVETNRVIVPDEMHEYEAP